MITSSRSSSDRVAEWRMRSIASFTLELLLDVGVGPRDVGLGLVVIVVTDEKLDRVVGEEALELAVQLRGEDLVGGDHQRRALQGLDDLGHGEGLARAGDAEQHLAGFAILPDPLDQLPDRGRLVAGRLIVGHELERLAALGLVGPSGLVRHEGLGRVGLGKAGSDLNRHRPGYMGSGGPIVTAC